MCPDFFPGCCSGGHRCSHIASILTCVCTTRPSRTWPMVFECSTDHYWKQRHIIDTLCPTCAAIQSICPSSFPQAYNATPCKWSNYDNRYKILGKIYRRMTFGTFMTVCMREYMPALSPEGATLCFDVTVWATLSVTCVSFGLNLSYIPTMINYLTHQLAIQWTCPWAFWIFFRRCITYSYLSYWISASNLDFSNKLFILQKGAVRIICNRSKFIVKYCLLCWDYSPCHHCMSWTFFFLLSVI